MSDIEESDVEFSDYDILSSIGEPEYIPDSSSSSSLESDEDDAHVESEPGPSRPTDHLRVVPYAHAPMYTEAEIEARDQEEQALQATSSANSAETSNAQPAGASSTQEMPHLDDFCSCGKCVVMPKRRENVCCDTQNTATFPCVTEDPEFQGSVLCKLTLEAIGMQEKYTEEGWIDFKDFRLRHKEYRYLAYRQASWNLHRCPLGDGNRIPLPACVVTAILQKFPLEEGETRVGFRPSAKQRCQRASLQ